MLQLVYISTARRPLADAALESLLATARRRNRLIQVTGLLVVGGNRFLQALEGPRMSVLDTFGRITTDPRHFAIVELARREVEMRDFGNWAMAYQTGGQASEGAGLRATVANLVEPLEDKDLRALFTGFAEMHAKAA